MCPDRPHRRRAFSLIEVLVVSAIVAVLLGLLAAAVLRARATADANACRNHLKHLGLASHAFHDHRKRLPPAFGFAPRPSLTNGAAGLGTTFYHLLPFVEQDALYKASRHKPRNKPKQDFYLYTANKVHQQPVGLFVCPADFTVPPGGVSPRTKYAASSYAGNYLVFGVVDANYVSVKAGGAARLPTSLPDGTGQTILFAEKYAAAGIDAAANGGRAFAGGTHWAYFQSDCNGPFVAYHHPGLHGTDANSVGPLFAGDVRDARFQVRPGRDRCNPCLAATPHAALNVGLADGSVRSLAPGMDRFVWWAYLTPAGGDRIDK